MKRYKINVKNHGAMALFAACETKAFRGLVKQIDNDLKANA